MKNLKNLRELRGLAQVDLAKKLNITKQTVYKWERGMSPVAPLHWSKYASILNVDPEQFEDALIETLKSYAIETLNTDGLAAAMKSGRYSPEKIFAASQQLVKTINEPQQPITETNVRQPTEDGCFVPIITSAAAATCNPGMMPLLDCVNQYSEDKTWFKQAKDGDFVIEVTGTSMSPWYPDGTLLLVRPYQELKNGQRVVAVLDSGEIVFKVYAEKDNQICLFSINGDGKDYIFKKPIVPLRYICRVIASQRNEDALDEEMSHAHITHGWQDKLENLKK